MAARRSRKGNDQPRTDSAGRGGGLWDCRGRKTPRPWRLRRVPAGAQADALELRPGIERMDEAAQYSRGHSPPRLRRRRRQAFTRLPASQSFDLPRDCPPVPASPCGSTTSTPRVGREVQTRRHRAAHSACGRNEIHAIGGAGTPATRPRSCARRCLSRTLRPGCSTSQPTLVAGGAVRRRAIIMAPRSSTEGSTWSVVESADVHHRPEQRQHQ